MQGAKITAHIPTATAGQQQQVNFLFHIVVELLCFHTNETLIGEFIFLLQLIQLQQQVPGNVLPSVATIVQAAAHSIASRPGNVSVFNTLT